jgi:hypothetical protein
MNATTLGILVVGAVVVAGAIATSIVLLWRRSAHSRVARELVPPPSHPPPQAAAAPGGGAERPPPQAPPPPVMSGASGSPELPELVSQPPVAGGWTSILAAHTGPDDPTTMTPEGVDERDPAELAQAAAAAEAQAEDQPAAAPSEQGQDLAPVPDTPSELLMASSPDPSRLRLLGLVLGLLTERTRQEQPPQLGTALARLGDGDQERARAQLSTLSLTLMGEDQLSEEGEAQLSEFLGDVLGGEMANGFGFSTMPEFQQALNAVTPELRHRLDTIVWSRNADAINILTAEDVEVLERVAVAMTAALILDTTYGGRPAQEDAEDGGETESDTESEAGTSTGTDPHPE